MLCVVRCLVRISQRKNDDRPTTLGCFHHRLAIPRYFHDCSQDAISRFIPVQERHRNQNIVTGLVITRPIPSSGENMYGASSNIIAICYSELCTILPRRTTNYSLYEKSEESQRSNANHANPKPFPAFTRYQRHTNSSQ
ncbi:hypothetical protein ACRALDRAFT_2020454 [Sodiomyces alcalophilus JCM 7366]|uniref:uncharacterized protein n=1 Tax=Sodiomyces alcalophilus JCM 7366 TaxID=591952 RepID=UPI0039B38F9D